MYKRQVYAGVNVVPAQNSHIGKLVSEIPSVPMSKMYIDFSGPYPASRYGNTMLLIWVDSFTKFMWMFPLRKAIASTTVQELENSQESGGTLVTVCYISSPHLI